MRYHREQRSQCDRCPLRDSVTVLGEGPVNPNLVIIGEAPGRKEVQQGRPFVGDAGRYLNIGLSAAGIMRHRCYIMNVLPCKPPNTKFKNNDINSEEAQEALKLCRKGFMEELVHVTQKCKTVLTLGETALKYILSIEDGILKIRGSVYDFSDLVIVPTYHPAFLGYMKHSVKTIAVYHADLKKAKRISEGDRVIYPPKDYNLYPTYPELMYKLSLPVPDNLIAVDVEATSLDPVKAELVCLGIGQSISYGLSVPFLRQGNVSEWSMEEREGVKAALNNYFMTNDMIFQNACYDVQVLKHNGINVPFDKIKHDTMILAHLINPELPQNLGFIASIHADVPYHKGLLLNRTTKITDIPDTDLRTYNLDDCTILFRVLPSLLSDLKEAGMEDLYYEERIPMLKPLIMMMERGIKLDKKVLKKWVDSKTIDVETLKTELFRLGKLPEGFNLNSGDDLRLFLFGIVPNKCRKAEGELKKRRLKIQKYQAEGRSGRATALLKSHVTADLQKKAELAFLKPLHILKNFKGRKTKKRGQYQVNEENLLSLRNHLNKRLSTIEGFKNQDRFVEEKDSIRKLLSWLLKYNEYTRVSTLISNYGKLGRFVKSDGRIHCNMNPIGTRTGRISFSEPNLGTLPKKRDSGLRKAFVPEKGFTFLSADYSNAEFVALAYITQDPKLIEIVEKGLNVHDENTKAIFHITPSDPKWKSYRDVLKQYQFGKIQYGGSNREIFRKLLVDCPELEMTFNQFIAMNTRYEHEHPVHTEWIRKQQEVALKTRKIKTPMGFTRTLYGSDADIKKQAINTPIQGMIAHLINRAMITIEDALEKFKSKMILQVYDQLLFEVWPEEMDEVEELVVEVMERPVDIYGRLVSFKVDVSTGPNFGELKEEKLSE